VHIRGLPWKILAYPRVNHPSHNCLGFFLQCNGEAKDLSWKCHATAMLKLQSHKEGQDDKVLKISHQFDTWNDDWGFSNFIAFDVSPSLFFIIGSST
jgi:ubiquitin carboxyl-terminal hydrolase 7